ncbi:hypothetical protein FB446DRAFT_772983 [Lentinula raphanica]|nr:hypothetical protein FB446DRAFT_772983 [Lentinula raphanica]
MANYLPVLLYSVGSNVVPDDSSLSTLPRGQVDYLTHDWQEEDVWRSWRNMTRQKNEIANGVRLENASWRTWWKQRNKLKTVSPETLNWLKDSDVTWLYGPLHTAVEWTPPPKPKPDETDHKPASAHDRLDLSEPKHKSILKYRSISEMLTSDLPSPLFSPAESENESDGNENLSREGSDADPSVLPTRPSLSHTKSDTHIIRWGPDRAFRKDSPPRVDPTGATHPSSNASHTYSSSHHVYSATNLSGYFASHIQGDNAPPGELSSSSSSPKGGSSEVTPSGGVHSSGHKKKHITFNTFVEQCIAIDQPKPKDITFAAVVSEVEDDWYARNHDSDRANHDDGYDEDGEDGFDGDWGLNECAISTDSESDADQVLNESACDDEEDEDDGAIHMRSRRDSFDNKNNARLRSTSKVSSSSSSSASSGDYSSSGPASRKPVVPNIRRRRRSDGPKHISLPRKGSSSLARNSSSTALSSSDKEMVSIAPIAPTMLKTGSQVTWDGFGIHGVQSPYNLPSGAWSEGFGDDFSDDGGNMHVGPGGAKLYFGHNDSKESAPVGLVYMPPAAARFGNARIPRANSNTSLDSEAEVELTEDIDQKDEDEGRGAKNVEARKDEANDKMYHHREAYSIGRDKDDVLGAQSSPVPIVTRTPPAVELGRGGLVDEDNDVAEEDAYDYFGGPDLGEDFALRKTTSSARRKLPRASETVSSPVISKTKSQSGDGERQSRSRSRSRSRTPSPSYVPQSNTPAISVPGRAEHISPPPAPSSSSSLLSPPQRGREFVNPESPTTSRGRSSRTSTSFSDRSRSHSNHSSPLGSLSPEGIGSAYSANGRGGGDRERDRERSNRSGGRGRERTERRLSHSVSPDAVDSVSSLGPDAGSSVSSSSSGSQTVVAQSESRGDHHLAEEIARSSHPTPANSPVISMSSVAHAIARMNGKSPMTISDPHVTSPRLSCPSDSSPEPSSAVLSSPTTPTSASSPTRDSGDDGAGVVGKAVGIVSSAGAYLGFWNNGTT